MKKIISILGGVCCCLLTVTNFALAEENGGSATHRSADYDCTRKIAKLERKLEEARNNNRSGQITGLEKALAKTREHCDRKASSSAESGGIREKYSEFSDKTRETMDEWQDGAKENWADLKEGMHDGMENVKEDLAKLKEKIQDLNDNMAKAIKDGANSETVNEYKAKLKKANEELRELLKKAWDEKK